MLNALTIDVEDYFQVEGFASCVSRDDWPAFESRVVNNTRKILDLFDECQVKGTFFILGWIADRFPEVVTDIARRGHEIASHGYEHRLVYSQSREDFQQDVAASLGAITRALKTEDMDGVSPIIGYRAPTFSITADTPWAHHALASMGISYDCSVFPIKRKRYGVPSASRFATRHESGLLEFPMSTVHVLGRNVPVGGGGYFRLYPLSFTVWALKRINAEGHPAVVYLHPWEVDPQQPRITCAGKANTWRHYVNIDKTEARVRRLLKRMEFGPVCEVFAEELRAGR